MGAIVLLYVGAAAVFVWGLAHLFPTGSIVRGFGALSDDNRRILQMEWIGEGLTLMFLGVLVAGTAASADPMQPLALWVYRASAAMLVAMAVVSTFTGARNAFIAFRLCPYIFGGAAILFAVASTMGG